MRWTLVDDGSAPRLPDDAVIMDRRPGLLAAAAAAITGTLTLGVLLWQRGLVALWAPDTLRCVAITVAAPVYWNTVSRFEYRTQGLSVLARGSRAVALNAFALSILALSSAREAAFVSAMPENEMPLPVPQAVSDALATALLIAGSVIAFSGFAQLGVRGTYMGEAFGFMCPALITTFPFNVIDDPMYFGSSLLHWGAALRARSPTGCWLALVVSVAYWVAATVFENPFTHARYALHNKTKDLSKEQKSS